jgi:ribosomal protein S12 methylthiotransferase
MYPSGIQRELVDLMARAPRIVPYLDIPIQHGSDRILQRMRRPERRATILERVGWLRSALPDLSLRSTVIVGFPGETEDDFRAMLELLREVRFDYLGAFAYSVEDDTPAASMPDQVPDALKRERLEELLELQRTITQENNESRIDGIVPVLIDRAAGSAWDQTDASGVAIGRTAGQALEVDGVMQIENGEGLETGSFVQVHITDALEYDLIGRATGRIRAQSA